MATRTIRFNAHPFADGAEVAAYREVADVATARSRPTPPPGTPVAQATVSAHGELSIELPGAQRDAQAKPRFIVWGQFRDGSYGTVRVTSKVQPRDLRAGR